MGSSNSNIEHGMLIRQWTWPVRMVFWWVLIAVSVWGFTMGAHWVWALRHAPEAPLAHEQLVLEREVEALSRLTPGLFEPREVALWIGTSIRDTALMSSMGFARALMNWPVAYRTTQQKTGSPSAASADPGRDFVLQEVATAGGTWAMLVTGTYIFAVRTAMYVAALPLLLLGSAVGAVDGLVARANRKACAGRESASLYHRAKLGLSFVAIMGYIVCLAVPSLADPVKALVPLTIVMALLLRTQCAYYKKYL
jgi:integrating conjugative element membrane protein (TIGR03747 family)